MFSFLSLSKTTLSVKGLHFDMRILLCHPSNLKIKKPFCVRIQTRVQSTEGPTTLCYLLASSFIVLFVMCIYTYVRKSRTYQSLFRHEAFIGRTGPVNRLIYFFLLNF